MTPGKRYLLFLHWFARVGAIAVICLATAVICGWVLNIAVLKSVLPALATMKVNSAGAFLAAGVALWLLQVSKPGSRSFDLARALSVGVALVGGLTLAEDIFLLDLRIDEFFLSDIGQAVNTGIPGRMAPATSFNFLLVGFALLVLKARRSGLAASAQWLVAVPLFVATLAILGHAYGVSALYEVRPYTSMAVHTALTFFVLTLSVMAADPAHGVAQIATSDTAGEWCAAGCFRPSPSSCSSSARCAWQDSRRGCTVPSLVSR